MDKPVIQTAVGSSLNVSDFAQLYLSGEPAGDGALEWFVSEQYQDMFSYEEGSGNTAIVVQEAGNGFISARCKDNKNVAATFAVQKGTEILITPTQTEEKVISSVKVNGKKVSVGDQIIADGATEIQVDFAKTSVKGMPRTVPIWRTVPRRSTDIKKTGGKTHA